VVYVTNERVGVGRV